MTTLNLKKTFEKATRLDNEAEKIAALKRIVSTQLTSPSEDNLRAKEDAILLLGQLLCKSNLGEELISLIREVRPFLQQVSKAKAGKLVRQLVDLCLDMDGGNELKVPLCQECIEWSERERRTFLRQALQVRLMSLYYDTGRYNEALQLGSDLLRELKKMDDKILLVEVQLLESKVYYRLGNLQRSRAALTSARTTANAIYCPQKLQAALDMQSGILHAADERDFKTAYSYFYEAFEGYDSFDQKRALEALKYMLLAKIMLNSAEEVSTILNTKLCVKYVDGVNGMRAIAISANKRSLADFLQVKDVHREEFRHDPVLDKHLTAFYDTLLTQNLLKIIEPFSRVQISHIAELIALPQADVEKKLSQMILDKQLNGILDQGAGVLEVYEEQPNDDGYATALEHIQSLGLVVDQLYHKAKKLT